MKCGTCMYGFYFMSRTKWYWYPQAPGNLKWLRVQHPLWVLYLARSIRHVLYDAVYLGGYEFKSGPNVPGSGRGESVGRSFRPSFARPSFARPSFAPERVGRSVARGVKIAWKRRERLKKSSRPDSRGQKRVGRSVRCSDGSSTALDLGNDAESEELDSRLPSAFAVPRRMQISRGFNVWKSTPVATDGLIWSAGAKTRPIKRKHKACASPSPYYLRLYLLYTALHTLYIVVL